jgi:transcriptional regulator with XRE-family HTH domain
VNLNILKAKIVENGLTQKEVAEEMGLSPKTLNAKLNGKRTMYVNELELLRLKLKLDNRTLSRLLYESEV